MLSFLLEYVIMVFVKVGFNPCCLQGDAGFLLLYNFLYNFVVSFWGKLIE